MAGKATRPEELRDGRGAWVYATSSFCLSGEWQRFDTFRSMTPAPGGESMLDVQARAVRAVIELNRQYPSGTVAVVFHGDVIRSVLLHCLGMPIDFLHRIEVSPARISVVDLAPHEVRVLQMNGDTVPTKAISFDQLRGNTAVPVYEVVLNVPG